MVIIRHIIKDSCIELELRYSYTGKFNELFNELLTRGFTYNKLRRMFNKSYHNKEYTEDTFDRDIEFVKNYFIDYKYEVFKLLKEEKTYD